MKREIPMVYRLPRFWHHVFDDLADQELAVCVRIEYIREKKKNSSDEFQIAAFDLYQIIINMLN